MTRHAMLRLTERATLEPEDLIAILDGNFATKVGACCAPGKHNLVHRLFFSPSDRGFFVAIQNVLDGAVITLLTFDQYRNHYSHVSITNAAYRTVNRMVTDGIAPEDCWQPVKGGEHVFVQGTFGSDLRQVLLGQFRAALTGPNIDELGAFPNFWRWVAKQCLKRNLPLEQIHRVTARHSYGDAQEICCPFALDHPLSA